MQSVELYPGVISDPNILGGKPVIKGTRVPVSLVLGSETFSALTHLD